MIAQLVLVAVVPDFEVRLERDECVEQIQHPSPSYRSCWAWVKLALALVPRPDQTGVQR